MSNDEAPMNLWLPVVTEQFPELGHAPETWNLIDLSANFGKLLERATRSGDREMTRRVLGFVLWLESQSRDEESLVYVCQDILRETIRCRRSLVLPARQLANSLMKFIQEKRPNPSFKRTCLRQAA